MLINGTTLTITSIVYRYIHHSPMSDRSERQITVAIRDTNTNQTGHLQITQEHDTRDVTQEEHTTDNPALFENNHPEADWWTYGDIADNNEIHNDNPPQCDIPLEYTEKNGQWGLWL